MRFVTLDVYGDILEMRRKVEYVENEAERASLACRQSRGAYMTSHDREQKPLGSDLDNPRYCLKAVQSALDARLVSNGPSQIELSLLT